MDRATHTRWQRTLVPQQGSVIHHPDEAFNRALRQAREQPSDQRCSALTLLIHGVDECRKDRQIPSLTALALATAALADAELGELAELLVEKFCTLSQRRTADQRNDDAISFAHALLSAAELHDTHTLLTVVGKLAELSRVLPTEALAELLIAEVHQHLSADDDASTCTNILQAADLVRSLPARLRLGFLASLSDHIPDTPANRSSVLPVLLNQIGYLPGTQERQDLMVRMNQALYQSRIIEQS